MDEELAMIRRAKLLVVDELGFLARRFCGRAPQDSFADHGSGKTAEAAAWATGFG